MDVREDVKEVSTSISQFGRKGLPLTSDITKIDRVKRVVQDSIREFGKIDVLVNNAGIVLLDDAENLPEEIGIEQ